MKPSPLFKHHEKIKKKSLEFLKIVFSENEIHPKGSHRRKTNQSTKMNPKIRGQQMFHLHFVSAHQGLNEYVKK